MWSLESCDEMTARNSDIELKMADLADSTAVINRSVIPPSCLIMQVA